MNTSLDLSQLARARPAAETTKKSGGKRSFVSRYVVSGAILIGFAALLAWGARDRLLPRKSVTVVPVVVTRAEVQDEGTPLFQAAGWIEPRPTPLLVTALTEGVVEQVLVVEGQPVKAGQPIAKLIEGDAKLVVRDAEATLQLRQAEIRSAEAELTAAELRVKHPAHLEAGIAEADSLLAKTETELAKVPFLIDGANARLGFARRNLEGKRSAGTGIPERILQQAETDLATVDAELAELKQRGPRLEREVETLKRKRGALAQQRELLIEESRQLANAKAKLQAAQAKEEQAKLATERAKLALERTTIKSPIDGKVLQLVARPGTRVTAMEGAAALGAATIVTLYDPNMLQVRADVRLEDVGHVQSGQVVRIETASIKTPLEGFVLQPTSVANVQKNTLEVKVAIKDPPPTIRPEMLVSTTFLAPKSAAAPGEIKSQEKLLIPKQLIVGADQTSQVWIVDPMGLAELRTIRVGRATAGGLVEVLEGLTPTDKLISGGRDGLQAKDRVTITADDPAIGVPST